MATEFKDFSIEVKEKIERTAIAFLHEIGGELASLTARNIQGSGRWHTEQKTGWQCKVDESELEATIGNPMERSLWTEFGTGDFAEGDKGRSGWWVYARDDNSDAGSSGNYAYKGGRSYTKEEAIDVMKYLRSKGLDAHITHGQQAQRPFRNAYTSFKPKIIKEAEERFREIK